MPRLNWPETASPNGLNPGEVHVWQIWLDDSSLTSLSADQLDLSNPELQRAARFVNARSRADFITQRFALRRLLGHYLNIPPRAVQIHLDGSGKPRLDLPGPPLHFSQSRSAGLGLLAFTTVGPLGVDVERVHDFPEREAIIQTHFSRLEQSALSARPLSETLNAFFMTWTLKEAVLKMTGEGLAGMSRIEVEIGGRGSWRFRQQTDESKPADTCSNACLEPAPGWIGNVVIDGRDVALRLAKFKP